MRGFRHLRLGWFCCLLMLSSHLFAQKDANNENEKQAPTSPVSNRFQLSDIFQLEYADDPQISPDGSMVAYLRMSMDIMKDRVNSRLWMRDQKEDPRPMLSTEQNISSPRWSPDGTKIVYVAKHDKHSQIHLLWWKTGVTARLTQLTESPQDIVWSPDGKWIAFHQLVEEKSKPFAEIPAKPEGAEWAKDPKAIDRLTYRFDGQGYLKDGYHQWFVLPVDGGTPRQITAGKFNHTGSGSWNADSKSLVFSGNRNQDWEYEPLHSYLYQVSINTGEVKQLTTQQGPTNDPQVSPDGKQIAFVGYEDKLQGYQVAKLYVMNADGTNMRVINEKLDRSVYAPKWSGDTDAVFAMYDNQGETKVGYFRLGGERIDVAEQVGGTSLGRPYASGSFSVSNRNRVAFTSGTAQSPADVYLTTGFKLMPFQATNLNHDLFDHKTLGEVEEFWFESSHDQRKIQGWIVKPPEFDAKKKYPLILEIHGGPFANYGNRFSAEIQLYAAAGYVVVYINPRGSTGYGAEFGNLIHHAYPGHDYDDLMSGVDAVINKGYIDDKNLFVTGGSGGGVLSSWTVGKTNRFNAAVVAKPVINMYSFVLTSDAYNFFYKYWFPGYPWDHVEHYHKRSPLSLVGNVTTPTMLMTGEVDYRTPISESEQFYQALKLRKIDTMLVRIPDASHGIANRPSNMIRKVAYILKWFEKYRVPEKPMD